MKWWAGGAGRRRWLEHGCQQQAAAVAARGLDHRRIQVLHFRPNRWPWLSQRLEITSGELLPDQPVQLLQAQPSAQRRRRWELSRVEAIKLFAAKQWEGWRSCAPHWAPPAHPKPRDGMGAGSM